MKVSKLADDYLQLKSLQADLSKKEEELKLKLLALKDTEIEGKLGRVTITTTEGRTSFDADLLKKYVPAATLLRCQKTGNTSLRFSVKARLSATHKAA